MPYTDFTSSANAIVDTIVAGDTTIILSVFERPPYGPDMIIGGDAGIILSAAEIISNSTSAIESVLTSDAAATILSMLSSGVVA